MELPGYVRVFSGFDSLTGLFIRFFVTVPTTLDITLTQNFDILKMRIFPSSSKVLGHLLFTSFSYLLFICGKYELHVYNRSSYY